MSVAFFNSRTGSIGSSIVAVVLAAAPDDL